MPLDPEQLRRAMRAWTTGVTVVTVAHNGERHGMTVNSFTSVSLNPPLVVITLRKQTHTHALVEQAGAFGVSILAADQKELADRFAGKHTELTDRFAGLEVESLTLGTPLLKHAVAQFDCQVVSTHLVGENTLFVAEVIAVRGEGAGDPLVYHNRVYWELKK